MAIITANFNSTCPRCGRYINKGEQIDYTKGQKATHATCKAPPRPHVLALLAAAKDAGVPMTADDLGAGKIEEYLSGLTPAAEPTPERSHLDALLALQRERCDFLRGTREDNAARSNADDRMVALLNLDRAYQHNRAKPAVVAAPPPAHDPAHDPATDAAPYVVWERIDARPRPAMEAWVAAQIGRTRRYDPISYKCGRASWGVRKPDEVCAECHAAPGEPCGTVVSAQDATSHRSGLPGLRSGGAVPLPNVPLASVGAPQSRQHGEPGVYVVAEANPREWRYQSTQDNEDMGDMTGANWSGPLYLRVATPAEAELDARERDEADRPRRELLAAEAAEKAAEKTARAHFDALEHVDLGMRADNYLTPEEQTERKTSMRDLWVAREHRHGQWEAQGSYIHTWQWHGEPVLEEYTYVYDWDQPHRLAGPPALLAHIRAVDAEREAKQQAKAAADKAVQDAFNADPPAAIRRAFLDGLDRLGTVGDTAAFVPANRAPLASDWTTLRDEVLALDDAAFCDPGPDGSPLAKMLWHFCGGDSGHFYTTINVRGIYNEWKMIAVRAEQKRRGDELVAAIHRRVDVLNHVAAEVGTRWRAWVRQAWQTGELDGTGPITYRGVSLSAAEHTALLEASDSSTFGEKGLVKFKPYPWKAPEPDPKAAPEPPPAAPAAAAIEPLPAQAQTLPSFAAVVIPVRTEERAGLLVHVCNDCGAWCRPDERIRHSSRCSTPNAQPSEAPREARPRESKDHPAIGPAVWPGEEPVPASATPASEEARRPPRPADPIANLKAVTREAAEEVHEAAEEAHVAPPQAKGGFMTDYGRVDRAAHALRWQILARRDEGESDDRDMGTFEARSAESALEKWARENGYASFAGMCRALKADKRDWTDDRNAFAAGKHLLLVAQA